MLTTRSVGQLLFETLVGVQAVYRPRLAHLDGTPVGGPENGMDRAAPGRCGWPPGGGRQRRTGVLLSCWPVSGVWATFHPTFRPAYLNTLFHANYIECLSIKSCLRVCLRFPPCASVYSEKVFSNKWVEKVG